MPRYRSFAALAAVAIAAAASASPIPGDKYVATWVLRPLTAAAEVPGPGNTAASGEVTLQADWAAHKVCYAFDVRGLDGPITGAHIHKGAKGEQGAPVVVFKKALRGDAWDGCADVTPDQILEILKNPAGYYVNVHTAGFPSGALRAQLDNPNAILDR